MTTPSKSWQLPASAMQHVKPPLHACRPLLLQVAPMHHRVGRRPVLPPSHLIQSLTLQAQPHGGLPRVPKSCPSPPSTGRWHQAQLASAASLPTPFTPHCSSRRHSSTSPRAGNSPHTPGPRGPHYLLGTEALQQWPLQPVSPRGESAQPQLEPSRQHLVSAGLGVGAVGDGAVQPVHSAQHLVGKDLQSGLQQLPGHAGVLDPGTSPGPEAGPMFSSDGSCTSFRSVPSSAEAPAPSVRDASEGQGQGLQAGLVSGGLLRGRSSALPSEPSPSHDHAGPDATLRPGQEQGSPHSGTTVSDWGQAEGLSELPSAALGHHRQQLSPPPEGLVDPSRVFHTRPSQHAPDNPFV